MVVADSAEAAREKVAAARLSVISNVLLVALKLVIGIQIGSVAVLSEAIHSGTDLVAAMISFFAVRAAGAPPDDDHPYGHGKLESLSCMAEALLIVTAGVLIVYEAMVAIERSNETPGFGWGMVTMIFSAVTNVLVARRLFTVARRTDSVALAADGQHLMIDVGTSVGVVVGLGAVALTGWRWLDPIVALIVAVFVFLTGWRIAAGATRLLLDTRLPDSEVQRIKAILDEDNRVLSWHKLRTRKAGWQRHVDVHVQVDDDMSLKAAHQLTEELEDRMRAALPNVEVIIHTEPYEEEMRHHQETPH